MDCENNSENNLEIVLSKTSNKVKQNCRFNNQKKRMEGQTYEGLSKGRIIERKPREMKEACKSKFCEKSSIRFCSHFTDDIRKEIFELFWKMSWDQKKLYVTNLIEYSNRQRITVENSRRSNTKHYFLKHDTNRIPVCRQMFLSTLGLSEKMVRSWTNSSGSHCTQLSQSNQQAIRSEKSKEKLQQLEYNKRLSYLKNWLTDIPKLESHYRRKYTTKIYFQTDFKTYTDIYELYSQSCKEQKNNDIKRVSFPNFMKYLKSCNYSLFKPRNDQCDMCLSYKSNNLSQDQFQNHRNEIDKMRIEKQNDIENAKSGLCLLFCIDLEAVKLLPQSKANSSYYKMKLQVHNFTIYNIITHESDNYVWDETEASLVASTFATIIIKHLKNAILQFRHIHHIIIYSDGCCYQNRNAILSNALVSLCVEKNITIEHKYLVVGHTQMECDATHSVIERRIKNKSIHLPFQLVELMKNARKNQKPLQVHQLNHDYFLNYETIPMRYSSIRPGKKTGEPTVNMLRALAYDPTGIIYYKTDINENYAPLPQRIGKTFEVVEPSQIYEQRLPISTKKWHHLQDLKKVIPADCHYFYDNIPFEN